MNRLTFPLTRLPHMADATARVFLCLEIHTIGQLLSHFPSRYINTAVRSLADVAEGETITVEAVVLQPPVVRRFGKNRARVSCWVASDTISFQAIWFNQVYVREKLLPGTSMYITGKWEKNRKQIVVTTTQWSKTTEESSDDPMEYLPVYPTTEGLSQARLRHWIGVALRWIGPTCPDPLPDSIRTKRQLIDVRAALEHIHRPPSSSALANARKRFIYEEFFWYQLRIQLLRVQDRRAGDGVSHQFDRERVRSFVRSLPYRLTSSQKNVIADILRDMECPVSMNRLLQGDVGSGKTAVAAVALFACAIGGKQGALMVPTELLAAQHAHNIKRLFEPYDVHVAVLTGSISQRHRQTVLTGLRTGAVHLVVGTHALIQETILFADLGLVVVDEQHRFGVKQRAILKEKGQNPDILTMTATPIPRTLAMTAYGDRDVSVLSELPAGRQPIQTYWKTFSQIDFVYERIDAQVSARRQVYVVCPLIEQSDESEHILDVEDAISVHQTLCARYGHQRVGLLHGKLHARDKDATMQRFIDHELCILVATTVIEVGVDVPNATIMVIYNAERFGLSQLHQLRGRIGRGTHASECIVLSDATTDVAQKRLRTFVTTTDGFELARQDLLLRGPGDVFGTQQSGLPTFRLGNIEQDFALLEAARDDAHSLLSDETFWSDPMYDSLHAQLTSLTVPVD